MEKRFKKKTNNTFDMKKNILKIPKGDNKSRKYTRNDCFYRYPGFVVMNSILS